jgi:hypothetical protein
MADDGKAEMVHPVTGIKIDPVFAPLPVPDKQSHRENHPARFPGQKAQNVAFLQEGDGRSGRNHPSSLSQPVLGLSDMDHRGQSGLEPAFGHLDPFIPSPSARGWMALT